MKTKRKTTAASSDGKEKEKRMNTNTEGSVVELADVNCEDDRDLKQSGQETIKNRSVSMQLWNPRSKEAYAPAEAPDIPDRVARLHVD